MNYRKRGIVSLEMPILEGLFKANLSPDGSPGSAQEEPSRDKVMGFQRPFLAITTLPVIL